MHTKRYVLVVVVALFAVTSAQEKDEKAAKEAKVRELMELTGSADIGMQTLDAMLNQFKAMPGLDPRFVKTFRALAKPEDLVALIVPIWMKHIDDETLDAAIAFYKSPAGRKFARALPAMTQEAHAAGAAWGRQLAQKAMEEMQKTPARLRNFGLQKVEDMNNMRNMVGLLAINRVMPMKDGRVDVYALVRKGDIEEHHFSMFRSERFDTGPSKEEILAGDYKNFPYERFRGEVKPMGEGKVVPLLWDKRPDARNGRVVGYSHGAVKYLAEAEVQELLKAHGQLPEKK